MPVVPPKTTPYTRPIIAGANLSEVFDGINDGITGTQISVGTDDNIVFTSASTETESLVFFNSAGSGQGGRYLSFESTIAGTTGTLPFIMAGLEYAVNDDASRDYCVLMGHGFDSNATLVAGAQWGASGIKFEQHYNPDASTNQSETYFIHVARSGQEYRGFSISHLNHDRTNGTDTLTCAISADTIQFQDAVFSNRAVWTDAGLTMQSGQQFQVAAGIVTYNGTTGVCSTSAIKNVFNGSLTTDDDSLLNLQAAINLSSSNKTAFGTYFNPTWTAAASGSTIYGHRGYQVMTKGTAGYNGFTEAVVGVSGSGVTCTRVFGYRSRIDSLSSGSITLGHGFWAQSPNVSGGTLSTCYGVKIDDHTGYHAFSGGTGKYVFGDASANTLIGLYGATPIAQYSTTGTTTGFTAGAGTAVKDDSTFTGNTGTKAYTIGDIVRALKLIGALASS